MGDDNDRRVESDLVWREAERLAGTVLSMASAAARGFTASRKPTATSNPRGFATGEPACCVCPVCRLITVVGDPGPEVLDRLARKAGDLAVSMTAMLRTLSAHQRGADAPPGTREDRKAASTAQSDDDVDPWRAATTAARPEA